MRKFQHLSGLLIVGLILTLSCDKKEENPKPNEENELITTVTLRLTRPGGSPVSATWRDLSPDDESGRTIDTLFLEYSTLYTGLVILLDETKNPIDSVSKTVKEEATDHLFVYKPVAMLTSANLLITRTDHDANHLEVGLEYTLETKAAGNGGLQVILRHQTGEKNGTETPGDSDVDVVFPVKVR